jgi:protein-S-isoprenylcysteine O-methyltransferase Ste14
MSPILRRILQLLFLILIQALIMFISAGTVYWIESWIYLGLYFCCLLVAALILLPERQEVVAERSKIGEGAKGWDKWLTRILTIPSLGMLVVAGLDYRYDWMPNFNAAAQIAGGILFLTGYALVVWAMYTNRFFSTIVRIQTERGHVAITDGPYQFIRHPGYLGMLVSSFGGMLLLDSPWALLMWTVYFVLVLVRTRLEDRDLRTELPGYAEYSRVTRYRLFPRIW